VQAEIRRHFGEQRPFARREIDCQHAMRVERRHQRAPAIAVDGDCERVGLERFTAV
jgi:hypothetical protein